MSYNAYLCMSKKSDKAVRVGAGVDYAEAERLCELAMQALAEQGVVTVRTNDGWDEMPGLFPRAFIYEADRDMLEWWHSGGRG